MHKTHLCTGFLALETRLTGVHAWKWMYEYISENPITTDASNLVRQSELEAITVSRCQGQEIVREYLHYDWRWFCFSLAEKMASTSFPGSSLLLPRQRRWAEVAKLRWREFCQAITEQSKAKPNQTCLVWTVTENHTTARMQKARTLSLDIYFDKI